MCSTQWDTKDIQDILETKAHSTYNKEVQLEQAKLKGRIIDQEATNGYLRSKYATTSWTGTYGRAVRTGCINFQGKYVLEEEGSVCPLCSKQIHHNMTWHALLECDHADIQSMYKQWAATSTTQWEDLIKSIPPADLEAIKTDRER